jgi:hypothetical protein
LLQIFFLAWWSGVFTGGFAVLWCFLDGKFVVKVWWMCANSWWLTAAFLLAKNTPTFEIYFLWENRRSFDCAQDDSFYIYLHSGYVAQRSESRFGAEKG